MVTQSCTEVAAALIPAVSGRDGGADIDASATSAGLHRWPEAASATGAALALPPRRVEVLENPPHPFRALGEVSSFQSPQVSPSRDVAGLSVALSGAHRTVRRRHRRVGCMVMHSGVR